MPDLDPSLLKQLDQHIDENQGSFVGQSVASTDIGRVRHLNEDSLFQSDAHQLWAVADGLGGHSRGDYASKAIVSALEGYREKASPSETAREVEKCLALAHEKCLTAFRNKRTGSTVALMFHTLDMCVFLWAGDSRIYRLRDGVIELMTHDHTLAYEKFKRGEIPFEEIRHLPSSHSLTRAVGIQKKLKLDLNYCKAQRHDRYLLCTDGLYNDQSMEELQQGLLHSSAIQANESMVKQALAKGGKDNITAIVVDFV